MKQVILRQDISTGQMLPVNELIRIVKLKDGTVVIDPTKKLNGRGVYLAPNLEAITKIKKKRLIQRSLKVEINEELFDQIIAEIESNWD